VSRSRAAAASAALLGGALAGISFGAAGGTELTRTTIVEILMVIVGGLIVATAVLLGPRGRVYGGGALVLFGALAALTALSVLWSVAPELAYVEAGRTLAYLATFAAAVAAARIAPAASHVVLKGVLLGALAAVAYALASRVWPGALDHDFSSRLGNRLGQPFQYWNAVGTTAALAVPPLLWLGARRTGSVLGRALAYPAMGSAILAILLTQSRGALAAAALGCAAWLALVPLRLRSLPVLLLPAAGSGAVAAWALSKDAFSRSLQPLSAREAVAGEFGLLLVLMAAGLLVAGLVVNLGLARSAPPMRLRRRVGIGAVAVACAVPLVAFTSVAFSDRGLGGTIEDRVDELTSETETAPVEGAGRLTASESTRGKYWREAGRVFDDRPAAGVGAGNFEIARLRHRTDAASTRHAHGFVVQTLADLGLVGLAVSLALLAAWLAAVVRATGLHPRRLHGAPGPRRDWDSERIALVTLTLVAVVFGLQSIIDWTWFVPGPAAMALVAAGFVAARGPLGVATGPLGRAPRPLGVAPGPAGPWALKPLLRRPEIARAAAAGAVLGASLLVAWAIWQPEASDRAVGRALELADERRYGAAVTETEEAADADPLSPDPLLVRAAVETAAGRESAAKRSLEQAVLRFPGDPQTWLRLASFQLGTLDRPRDALETVRGVLHLDPFSTSGRQLFLEARVRLREQRAG
jgi:hypothetical protein